MPDSLHTLPDLIATMRGTVIQYGLFTPDTTVAVGVSGGADSTALLHALAGLRDEWRLTLVACHLNHGFRGEAAAGDAAYVRELCAGLGVACRVESVDVPGLARRRHLSSQQAARNVRHAFLRRVANEAGADRIALAHTRDDRTETMLLNILRGSGLAGLSGISPAALPLVRPLYDTTRAQVEAYCARHDLQFRKDSSNLKTAYSRNRVRLELLPLLRRDYNGQIDDALLRLADLAGADNALLDALAADALDNLVALRAQNLPEHLTLSAPTLNALPLALRRRALRLAILRVRGHLRDVDFEAMQNLLDALEQAHNYHAILPASEGPAVVLRCRNETLDVFQVPAQASSVPWSAVLNVGVDVPERTRLAPAGVTISAVICRRADLRGVVERWRKETVSARASNAQEIMRKKAHNTPDATLTLWARDRIALPLLTRAWQPGDRMRPRGLHGTKKLQDIFTDAKTPPARRETEPVVLDANGAGRILAVGGLRVDETALFSAHITGEWDVVTAWLRRENTPREQSEKPNMPLDSVDATQELLALLLEYEV